MPTSPASRISADARRAEPEELPSEAEIRTERAADDARSGAALYERDRPIELRPVEFDAISASESRTAASTCGSAPTGTLPDDPAIHQCVLAYASDMTLLDSALLPHGRTVFEKDIMAASLDHALWFHRPFRADDWLLYAQDSPIAQARAASPAG